MLRHGRLTRNPCHASLEESVREDIAWVHAQPLIREGLKQATQGYVFDIKSGKVTKVNAKEA